MLRMLKDKKGNEILQTLIIVAVIGALAITICVLISNKIKSTSQTQLNEVGDGLTDTVNRVNPQPEDYGVLK